MKNKPSDRRFKKPPFKGPAKAPRRAPEATPAEKPSPQDHTSQESGYLKQLVASKTPVRVKLRNNEEVEGVVEYYDTTFIRLTREGDANLFIYKSEIKYLEERPRESAGTSST